MIAQISHTGNTAGVIIYHDKKMQNGVATILDSQNINTSSRNNIQASFNSYNFFSNEKAPTVHISINFHSEDRPKLTDENYKDIGKKYLQEMGYGNQPYIVYKHKDQAHPHIHIVTSRIKDDGNKITTWGERYRSQNISRKIEISHDLKQVSSIKNQVAEARVLDNEKEYLTYLRTSVKEALSYRPKRRVDLENLLSSRYGIQLYRVNKKGIGFALIGKDHKRYKNGYGTKGIGASKINKNWSSKQISVKLSKNFQDAPKRYRNLKATEDLLIKELQHFNSISTIDFDVVFADKGTFAIGEENQILVLDTKGKNVYSERDLKNVDFEIFGKTTELQNPETSGLFKTIADETLWAYKNEFSKKLLLSSFINDVADRSTFLDYHDRSTTYNKYKPLLSENHLERLRPYLNDWFTNLNAQVGGISIQGTSKEKVIAKLVEDFSKASGIDNAELQDRLRLNTYNESYSPSSTERGVFALMEKSIDPSAESNNKFNFQPNLIFDIGRYFDHKSLSPDLKEKVEFLLVDRYVSDVVYNAKKSMFTPEDFVNSIQSKGISLYKGSDNNVYASIIGYSYEPQIKGVKDFVKNINFSTKKPTIEFNDIRFSKAMDRGNIDYAFVLLKNNQISDSLYEKYSENPVFAPLWEENKMQDIVNSALWNYKNENSFYYLSDLKSHLKNNPKGFLKTITLKEKLPPEWSTEFLKKYTSVESINESTRIEKEHFKNTFELSKEIKSDNIAALIGLRNGNKGSISDLNGKFETDGHLSYSRSLETLQAQTYFPYYSTVFNEASFHLYGDKREAYKLDYSHLLVYESFRNHIPKSNQKDYQELFEKSYVDYFASKLEGYKDTASLNEKLEYLNSKGIRAIEKGANLYFKLGGSDHVFVQKNSGVMYAVPTDKQIHYLRDNGFSNIGERRNEQLRFVVALEKGNYTDAAWLLKQNKASISISGIEANKLNEVREKLNNLQNKNPESSKSIINTLKKEEGGHGHYGGKKSKNKKTKKGRRL